MPEPRIDYQKMNRLLQTKKQHKEIACILGCSISSITKYTHDHPELQRQGGRVARERSEPREYNRHYLDMIAGNLSTLRQNEGLSGYIGGER